MCKCNIKKMNHKDKNDIEAIKIDIADYYKRYGPMVFRRCRKFLQDEERAMDAMHEVFERLLLNKKRLRASHLTNLLFKISTNVCLNKIRAHRNHQFIDNKDILANIALYDESEERFIINNFLDYVFAREKKSTRDIAVMHFVEGMTLKEVAVEVGLSYAGIRKRIKKLRESVKNMEVFNEKSWIQRTGN